MPVALRVVGIVLNVFLAGLGFFFAPMGKKIRGLLWFGLWLLGSLFIPVLFALETNTFSLFWNAAVNIASAVDFARITKRQEAVPR